MKRSMNGHGLRLALIVCAAVAMARPAAAQDWPKSPVTMVLPYNAGGNTDTMGRMLAASLGSSLGQSVIVENKGGAAGALAAEYVAKAAKDGYTLFFATSAQISVTPFVQKVRYSPVDDFTPVSIYGTGPNVLAVNVKLPVSNTAELIAYAKAHPGELKYASGGNGTIGHLAAALFCKQAGLSMVHVPYRGGSQMVTDLMAGHVDMYLGNASEILPQAASGKIKLLGVTSPKRLADQPNLPAIGETLPGYVINAWNGLLAPAGTPKPIVEKLERETIKAAHEPAVIEKLGRLGIVAAGTTSADFVTTIQSERAAFRDAVAAAGIALSQ